MRWIFLILASCCEVLWFYCIAYLNQFTFKELYTFCNPGEGRDIYSDNWMLILGAIMGYVAFGIANMLFFARAIQKIAPAIAFSVWTGLALVGITVMDVVLKDISFNFWQAISIALILAGIAGVKITADKY